MAFKFLCKLFFLLILSVTAKVHETNGTEIETATESYSDVDTDKAIEKFVTNAIENYQTWLAQQDTSPVLTEEVHLDSKDVLVSLPRDMDAVLSIKNQYMANHSKYNHTVTINVNSDLKNKLFNVSYTAEMIQNGYILFSGEYNVSGSLSVLGTRITFTGQGIWRLKCTNLWELISYNTYTATDAGYIDLGSVEDANYKYYTAFDDYEYEELIFDNNGEISPEIRLSVYSGLSNMYEMYLIGQLETYKNSPPKQLLHTYLKEQFLSTKLDDIVSDWKPTTAKPESSSGISVLENVGAMFLSMSLIVLYIIF